MHHLGFSYKDAYSCPVWQRFWFINRFKSELKSAKENNQNPHPTTKNNNRAFRKAF